MPHAISSYVLSDIPPQQYKTIMERAVGDIEPFIQKVQPIIEAVRSEKDQALIRFAAEFDGAVLSPGNIAVSKSEFDTAFNSLERSMIEALEFCCDNVRRFHEVQMPRKMWMHEMHPGVFAGEKIEPIGSVACYVPRGKGSFPSMAMMTSIPAVVAEVPKISIITPPGPDGRVDAASLVVARLAGVENLYKCGGAQGVAAVAFGTETVPKCKKIVGPGSPFVAAAKQVLAGYIDPGPPAGPSEAIILADESANGRLVALDLINESEHGPDSSAFLVTNSARVIEETIAAIPDYWARMGQQRVAFSSQVLGGPNGGVILAENMGSAISFINEFAPEHLQIHAKSPQDYLGSLRHAGEILLGQNSAICAANFTLGANAVLPTGGAAHTHSALGVHDYLKRVSIGHMTRRGYDKLAPIAEIFARYEGFDAHANAVSNLRREAMDAPCPAPQRS